MPVISDVLVYITPVHITLVYITPVYYNPTFNLTTNHGQNYRYFRPCCLFCCFVGLTFVFDFLTDRAIDQRKLNVNVMAEEHPARRRDPALTSISPWRGRGSGPLPGRCGMPRRSLTRLPGCS